MSVPRSTKGAVGVAAAGAGAAALATAASACCVPVIAPLIVAVLGAGGAAWAAGLKPYGLLILAAAGLLLTFGYWLVYRPRPAALGEACPVGRPLAPRLVLWIASALWVVAAFLNFVTYLQEFVL